MTLGDLLKQYREDNKISMDEFSKRSTLSKGYISMLENNINPRNNKPIAPTLPTIQKIALGMGTDVDSVLKILDGNQNISLEDDTNIELNNVTLDELDRIKKYRDLDDRGREHVDSVLEWETDRVRMLNKHFAELAAQAEQIIELKKAETPTRIISYYQRLASAGSGECLFDSIPCDSIEVLDNSLSERADFVLGVNGHSMEPTYCNGDKVLVEISDEIPIGSIGIFTRGNECFIKELGTDRLISHNTDKNLYPDIPASEEIRLVGKVLGKAEE